MNLSDFSLENKVALITGGTSGLGKMMALALAKAGAFVWIASSRNNADETLQEIKQKAQKGVLIKLMLPLVMLLKKLSLKFLNSLKELTFWLTLQELI